MKILRDSDLVYIDPINGWHYHMKECWMAGPKEIKLGEVMKVKPRVGKHFIPCACVEAYKSGRDIKNPLGANYPHSSTDKSTKLRTSG